MYFVIVVHVLLEKCLEKCQAGNNNEIALESDASQELQGESKEMAFISSKCFLNFTSLHGISLGLMNLFQSRIDCNELFWWGLHSKSAWKVLNLLF